VRQGEVKHFDFLEANLLKMEKFAKLATMTPQHAGDDFQRQALRISENYLLQLTQIRANVELNKRAIGLLNNSRSALSLMLQQLNDELVENARSPANTDALVTAINLNEAIGKEASATQINTLLDYLSNFSHWCNPSYWLRSDCTPILWSCTQNHCEQPRQLSTIKQMNCTNHS
jgi:hypothetical protein